MMFVLFAEGKKDGACVYGHSAAVAAPWQEAAGAAGATGTAFDLCALSGEEASKPCSSDVISSPHVSSNCSLSQLW